ncbi:MULTISPECIES: RodZ domain-containing protein [unclassified Halomonas]|uniref:RodZ domain-containing protein n=1 Tax=unclassified Halomonas TaxID=2609666 RepID=UPI0009909177|nr:MULTISPECIES: RodZ domain-containing protein [unclassified Halomonas]AQU83467.1 helix-turn-helix domain-containing protein [Halomonas sp. 'Soap Lake \
MSETQLLDSATSNTATPGELLLRQREALGVPLVDAARALNLRPAVIAGLEQDNYDEIPVTAYRRGYLRSYAKYLDMDDRLVLDAYQARHGSADTDRKVTPVSVARPPSKIGALLFKLVTLLVIVGLIAVTVMWWQSRGGSEPPSMGASPTIEEEEALSASNDRELTSGVVAPPQLPSETSTDASEAATSSAPAEATAEVSEEATQSAVLVASDSTPAADTSDDEQATEAAPAASPNTLELTFNEQSWTEIFDASNQRVFVGLQAPGTTASVEGTPPFRLTIGNATGVELRYQGEVVNLPQRAGANNVARFTLGE